MTLQELEVFLRINPNATFECTESGQIIIATGLYLHEGDDNLHESPEIKKDQGKTEKDEELRCWRCGAGALLEPDIRLMRAVPL